MAAAPLSGPKGTNNPVQMANPDELRDHLCRILSNSNNVTTIFSACVDQPGGMDRISGCLQTSGPAYFAVVRPNIEGRSDHYYSEQYHRIAAIACNALQSPELAEHWEVYASNPVVNQRLQLILATLEENLTKKPVAKKAVAKSAVEVKKNAAKEKEAKKLLQSVKESCKSHPRVRTELEPILTKLHGNNPLTYCRALDSSLGVVLDCLGELPDDTDLTQINPIQAAKTILNEKTKRAFAAVPAPKPSACSEEEVEFQKETMAFLQVFLGQVRLDMETSIEETSKEQYEIGQMECSDKTTKTLSGLDAVAVKYSIKGISPLLPCQLLAWTAGYIIQTSTKYIAKAQTEPPAQVPALEDTDEEVAAAPPSLEEGNNAAPDAVSGSTENPAEQNEVNDDAAQ